MKWFEFARNLGAATVGIVVVGLPMDVSTSGLVILTITSAAGIAYGMHLRSK